jgi:hypothetical protein
VGLAILPAHPMRSTIIFAIMNPARAKRRQT